MESFVSLAESLLKKRISRKQFVKLLLSGLALAPFFGHFVKGVSAETPPFNGRTPAGVKGEYDLVAAKGNDPYVITVKAVEAMGGMERFVKKGSSVVVKPNIGWDRVPEQAGNTNPHVVGALIDLSFKAGAKRVNVFDVTCNDSRRCYANSGIQEMAKEKGAHVYFPDDWNVIEAHFGFDSPLEGWPVLKDAIECDTFINVPILKHHGLTGLTLSMKNLMGVCSGNRGLIHRDIGRKLVDLAMFIKPDLNVIDAYRVLVRNGPTGGDLRDVAEKKMVLVSTDPTLADTYACRLVDVDPLSIPNIQNAVSRNFGISDLGAARMVEISA